MFGPKNFKIYSKNLINFKYFKLVSFQRPNMMLLCTSCNNILTTPASIQSVPLEKYEYFLHPSKHKHLQFIQNAFYSDRQRKGFNLKMEESKKLLTDKFETKRKSLQEKKENIVQGIREKKAKVQEKMEEIVERENIFTIPNLLCVTRGALAPYVGYAIVHEQYTIAFSLFVFAGLTDLVS